MNIKKFLKQQKFKTGIYRRCFGLIVCSFFLSACAIPHFIVLYPKDPENVPESAVFPASIDIFPAPFLSQETLDFLTVEDPTFPLTLKEMTIPPDSTISAKAPVPHSDPDSLPKLAANSPIISFKIREKTTLQSRIIPPPISSPNATPDPLPIFAANEPINPFKSNERVALNSPETRPQAFTPSPSPDSSPKLIAYEPKIPLRTRERTALLSPTVRPQDSVQIQKTPFDPSLNLAANTGPVTAFKLNEKMNPPKPSTSPEKHEIQEISPVLYALLKLATSPFSFKHQKAEVMTSPVNLPQEARLEDTSYLPNSLPVAVNAQSLNLQKVEKSQKPVKRFKSSVEILNPDSPPELLAYAPKTPSPYDPPLPPGWLEEEFELIKSNSLMNKCVAYTFFVDVSASMNSHLNNLGGGFEGLSSIAYYGYSWLAVFSTAHHGQFMNSDLHWTARRDAIKGRFGNIMNLEDGEGNILNTRVLTADIQNYKEVFFHTVSHYPTINSQRPPYTQGSLEQPLRAAKSFIERNYEGNLSIFENCNIIIFVIVANEPERNGRKNGTTALEVKNIFYKYYPDKTLIAYPIIPIDDPHQPRLNCLKEEKQRANIAKETPEIAKLADITGGRSFSICSENYEDMLTEISQDIKDTVENSVVLAKHPVPETVEVDFLEGDKLPWDLYGRKITFQSDNFVSLHVLVSYKPLDLDIQGI